MTVAGRTEERVGQLEREHRCLVDDHQVVVARQRPLLVAPEAALVRRVAERAMDRHRLVPGQITQLRVPRPNPDREPPAPRTSSSRLYRPTTTGIALTALSLSDRRASSSRRSQRQSRRSTAFDAETCPEGSSTRQGRGGVYADRVFGTLRLLRSPCSG
jgi:hypothetical protein